MRGKTILRRMWVWLAAFVLTTAFTTDAPRNYTIFLIGDSTMAPKNLNGNNPERGWGMLLQSYMKDNVKVDNHAVNGRSTKSFIDEGRWEKVLSRLKKGDYVFIEFGHNDEKTAPTLYTQPGSTFDENLRRFVRETRAKGGIPVLFNSIPRRNFPPNGTKFKDSAEARDFLMNSKGHYAKEGDVLVDTHGDYLVSPRKVAREMHVPFVDLNQLVKGLIAEYGREGSKQLWQWIPKGKYAACPNGRIDNTHLCELGASKVAGLAINAVADQIPEIAQSLK